MNTKLLLALFLATVSVMAVPQVYAQQPQPLVGTCLSDSQCDIVTLTNGTLMDNPYNPSLLITKAPIPQAEACTWKLSTCSYRRSSNSDSTSNSRRN